MGRGTKNTWLIAAGALALLFAAVAVALALVFWFVETASEMKESAHRAGHPYDAADAPRSERGGASSDDEDGTEADGEAEADDSDGAIGVEAEPEKTEEERQEDEDEKKVEAFDSLTDKWMEKEGGEVTMKDMDAFVAAFKSVPDKRKDECLHRALNLVSDDHVLLLAGILFDKTVEKEYLELVFNDILNRDEDVKKLILPRIYKDKTHPCWADTAWILDVTGETPNKENTNE